VPSARPPPTACVTCRRGLPHETLATSRPVREVFGKGNDFAAKITYAAKDPKGHLQAFRTSASLRVAVTVDMIATGTDVKPLECVFFMRDVRSAQYFEQMKGRGARAIPSADFQAVTPDATSKTRFVIVDAVGVTEHDFVEPPLNRDKGISLKKLLDRAVTITEAETATLASRLAALELQLTPDERTELAQGSCHFQVARARRRQTRHGHAWQPSGIQGPRPGSADTHRPGHADPLLWLSDALCGVVTSARTGEPQYRELIEHKLTIL